ncbi:DUF2284 domain-containing protein [Lachnospiraceae bacterium 47-T17]
MAAWYEYLIENKSDYGIHEIAVVLVKSIVFSDGVRLLCEQNSCGGYAKTWACPPGVGTMEECHEAIMAYGKILVYTTKHELEDSLDWEGMMAGKRVHQEVCRRVQAWVRGQSDEPLLYLAGEGCDRCSTCTYPDALCRFPEQMSPSIESYGIVVSELAKSGGIHYINGQNTVTYFGGICFHCMADKQMRCARVD